MTTVLIIGGYGEFGGRLANLLSDVSGLKMMIAGRSLAKAANFCDGFEGVAEVTPLELQRDDVEIHLRSFRLDIVIDASGPFQNYGDDPYRVVRACISNGVNYLDLADGAEFVNGVSRFDDEARQAGIFVLSGASSFPVLSGAVLAEMSRHMELQDVRCGLAPSPHAGIGETVLRAVLGYAGEDVPLMRDGEQTQAKGLVETMRYTIAPPGIQPLRNNHFSLVDVPDLLLLPKHFPTVKSVWMGAGPVPEVLHWMVNGLALFRSVFRFPDWGMFAPLFFWIMDRARFGERRAGMFVDAKGSRDGNVLHMSWHLIAEDDSGPNIPSMAIEQIVRKAIDDDGPEIGARAALGALTLEDYEQSFTRFDINHGFRWHTDERRTVFQDVLGAAFDHLPERLRTFHGPDGSKVWRGRAQIERGKNWFVPLICNIIGFPKQSSDADVEVKVERVASGEIWTRTFAGNRFSSVMSLGSGRNEHLVVEQFGPVSIALALVRDAERLKFVPRRANFLGLPLPRFLVPGGETFEFEEDGRFNFDVEVTLPMIGRLVRYRGWLEPVSG